VKPNRKSSQAGLGEAEMNSRKITGFGMIMTTILTLQVFVPAFVAKSQTIPALDPAIKGEVLNSTVQIIMYAPLPTNQPDDGQTDCRYKSYVMAKGFGTMVLWQGEKFIVTHNHWGEMLEDAEYVKIQDAYGNFLVKMGIDEFTSLIRYTDPGTLILDSPAGLPTTSADLGKDINMVTDDIVTVVRQDPVNPDQVDISQARVLRMKNYKGLTVVNLAILDDAMLVPGDSGGGIWMNGKLVGNTWASFINTIKLPLSLETSLAAPLPMAYFQDGEPTSELTDPLLTTDLSVVAIAK
jgi:hypothetical protein